MDVNELLSLCAERGVRLSHAAGDLRVHFEGESPDPALVALLRHHKQELLARLAGSKSAAIVGRAGSRKEPTPASSAQHRMWMLDRLHGQGSAYNMVGAFRLHGAVDRTALQAALDVVVQRHEALRTVYSEDNGFLTQHVQEATPVVWDLIDGSAGTVAGFENAIEGILRRESAWHFDLATGPVVRSSWIQGPGGEAAWILNLHHIACDGWSLSVIKRELALLYAAACARQPLLLPQQAVQYSDYTDWQRRSRQAARPTQLAYWRRKLEGMPQRHGLPMDHVRPAIQSQRGGLVAVRLTTDTVARLHGHCGGRNTTLFALLETAFAATVSLFSNERDIAIGTPVAGRTHPDVQGTVGLFVNTVVIRSDVDITKPFWSLLEANQLAIQEALAHQDLPFDALIEALKPERTRAHAPLVQILFAVQGDGERISIPGAEVVPVANPFEPVKFDLQVIADTSGPGLELQWRYCTDLFHAASVERMAECLAGLLEHVATNSDAPLGALALGPRGVAPWQASGVPRGSEVVRIETRIERAARAYPTRIAVADEQSSLTYAALDARADALAARLRALGVVRGQPVALCASPCVDLLVGILAVLKAGGAYVPLDPAYPAARLETMLADCGAAVLLSKHAAGDALASGVAHLVQLDAPLPVLQSGQDVLGETALSASDPAYIIYTSGTTGTPKGVVVAHAGVAPMLDHFEALAPLGTGFNGALWGSICFDVSVYEIFSALCAGGTLHIVPEHARLDPDRLFQWLDARSIHSAYMYAGYLEPFGAYLSTHANGAALQRMLVGVEPIASDDLLRINQQLPDLRIVNAYGPTEATVCCTAHLFDWRAAPRNHRVAIGRALADAQLYVLNAAGQPAPLGAIGELYVAGTGLAHGYLNRAQLTGERFVTRSLDGMTQRLYRTGDMVRCRPCGALEFIGRRDEQVKIRGVRIELSEVELRLVEQPEVSDAVVVAVGEGNAKRLVAYVVLSSGVEVDTTDATLLRLRRQLKSTLPDYMVPAAWVALERIPLTSNGKVDRALLPVPDRGLGRNALRAPENTVEEQILDLWKELLGASEIGTDDDFFALGGHSLLASTLLGRIHRLFDLSPQQLSLAELFDRPTVRELASVVVNQMHEDATRKKERALASRVNDIEEGVF